MSLGENKNLSVMIHDFKGVNGIWLHLIIMFMIFLVFILIIFAYYIYFFVSKNHILVLFDVSIDIT